jgi:hypothetical protein
MQYQLLMDKAGEENKKIDEQDGLKKVYLD